MSKDIVSICANCGKEGIDINNICNKCKLVKYCNAACKKKHRHKHKKECEEHLRLAAERAAKLHDEKLYKEPPSQFGDCQICFLRLPTLASGRRYYTCCGKIICSGCTHAPLYDNQGNEVNNKKCPFCRTPSPKSIEEENERLKKRVEAGDPLAIGKLGGRYRYGTNGYPQDYKKALEWYLRAGELGDAYSYASIGYLYKRGEGVEVDTEKAKHYHELAAMGGDSTARHNLGSIEQNLGNMDRALKHYMIASRNGFAPSLKQINALYRNGDATKEDYTTALRSYQEYLSEIKSNQRDKAAAADDVDYRYYESGIYG